MTNQSTGDAPVASTTFPSQIGLTIWNQVEKTDPNRTAPIPNTNFTSIAPVYMIKRATEVSVPSASAGAIRSLKKVSSTAGLLASALTANR